MILQEKIAEINLPGILESEGVQLRRSGNGFQFRCCFHDDRHPSGSLRNNGKWRFHCFWCGASGDAPEKDPYEGNWEAEIGEMIAEAKK